jgi:RHS repeat-associated protein
VNSKLEVAFFNQNKIHFFNSDDDYKRDNLLTNITTGNGVQEAITYIPLDSKYMNTYNSIYNSSAGTANYPNLDVVIDPNLFLVSKVEKRSKDVYKKRFFTYYGLVSNLEGLGSMGFRSVSQTDWHDDSTTIFSGVTINDIDLRGANTGSFTVPYLYYAYGSSIPADFISKSITTYNSAVDALQSNKVFKLKVTNAQKFNNLDGTSSESTNINYDIYNNVTSSTNYLKENGSIVHTNISTINYEAAKTAPYVVGRVASKEQSLSVSGSLMTNKETYTYTNELLTKIEKKGNGSNVISEENSYDSFGNVIQKKLTASDPAIPRITSYVYDSSGRFLKSSTDVENLTTLYEYNFDGTLKSETSPYGLTTSYTYDSWLKKLTAKNDNLNKAKTYVYARNAEKTIITTTADVSDGSVSEETFDDLGRKIKSGGKDLNGNFSYTSFLYDIYDRNYKESEPYFGSGPSQWNETKFDIYSRPTENISFNSRVTTSEYLGLTSKFTEGQKTKEAVKNAMGNIVSMTETTGGTITYKYYANGNLKQTDYNGVKIDIEQDQWGRRSKLTDPTAGVFIYSNNDYGELKSEEYQTKGVFTTFTRDDKGKILKKTVVGAGTDNESVYDYDSNTKLLKTITFTDNTEPVGTNKIITTYTYDNIFKRIISVVENKIGVSEFSTTYTYDGLGRIDTEIKQAKLGSKIGTVQTKNEYKNGDLYRILDINNKVLWQTNTLNAKGQIVESILGNGIKLTNIYDSYGYLSKKQYDKTTAPAGNILTLNTNFDYNLDKLDSRVNNSFGYSENFKYDELARLTEFTNANGVQEIQNYESSGKIKDNNLGTYNYSVTTNPNQNTSITVTPEATGFYSNREGIYNDSMESRSGWSLGAYNPQCISFDNTKSHTGKNSLKINTATSGVSVSYVQSDVSIPIDNVIDTQYTFSGWVYTDNPTAQLTLFQYNANETAYYSFVNSASTTTLNTWVPIEMTVLVPATVKSLRLRLDVVGSGNVWFDDVKIRKTSNVSTTDRELNVSYNAFQSPVLIDEAGIDKISFTYGDDNQRSTMYYGGLQINKLQRPYYKHYSADGSMEIKENRVTGASEFITYIGGDAYSSPIAAKSDGINPAKYLYLHRDYQGSILVITDENAAIVEKRLFDAWGGIVKVQDGAGNTLSALSILDRGYTGHEHLQSVGLVNMNARLYDPMLHRFLQVDNYIQDPTNTQNYNQYGYVLNNPLMYTDFSGNTCDCPGGGGPGIDGGGGTGISTDLGEFFHDTGIGDWARENLNFNNWSEGFKSGGNFLSNNFKSVGNFLSNNLKSLFGHKSQGPPPNMSGYVNVNMNAGSQLANSPYGSIPSLGIKNFGTIQTPTQHKLLGINMTALSEGNFFQQVIYGVANSLSVPVQYMMGRGVGDNTMRNLDGSGTTTDEATLSFGTLPLWFVGGGEVGGAGKSLEGGLKGLGNLLKGGRTFAEYRTAYWAGKAKPILEPVINRETGQIWKQYMELHHRFIPQRWDWAPNWLKNNKWNLQELSSLEHAMNDPYRARFAPKWVKDMFNLISK